jgi:hypothetical protein
VIQGLVEGTQEATQQLAQNYIAQQVYRPEQSLTEDVLSNAAIGAGVGVESELGLTALARLAGLGRGGRGARAPAPRSEPAPVSGQPPMAGDLEARLASARRQSG